jgi:hypothetical protein
VIDVAPPQKNEHISKTDDVAKVHDVAKAHDIAKAHEHAVETHQHVAETHEHHAPEKMRHREKSDAPADSDKGEREEQSKPWTIVIAVLVVLAIFAVFIYFGYSMRTPRPLEKDYGAYHFTMDRSVPENERVWWTQVQKGNQAYNLPFFYGPWELEQIAVPRSTLEHIWKKQLDKSISVYVSIDPNSTGTAVVAGANIARIIGTKYRIFNMNVSAALTAQGSTSTQVISCANSSSKVFVYEIRLGATTAISLGGQNGTCVVIQAQNASDLLRAADAYSYNLLGVMKSSEQ